MWRSQVNRFSRFKSDYQTQATSEVGSVLSAETRSSPGGEAIAVLQASANHKLQAKADGNQPEPVTRQSDLRLPLRHCGSQERKAPRQYEYAEQIGTRRIRGALFIALLVLGVSGTACGSTPSSTGSWSHGTKVDFDATGAKDGLSSVSCPSNAFCVAVGDTGKAYTYSDGTWSSGEQIAPSDAVLSVSCASASFCVAVANSVSDDGYGSAYIYSGGAWSGGDQIASNTEPLNSISCPTSSQCVVGDAKGNVLDYTGGTWTSHRVDPNAFLSSVSCPTPSYCALTDGGGVYSYSPGDGTASSRQEVDTGSALGSISCPSPSFCMLLTDDGHVFTNSGGTWSGAGQLTDLSEEVSCSSSSFCVAGDTEGRAFVYSGGGWARGDQIAPTDTLISDVSCASSAFCVAVATNGFAYVHTS
jgi:hypothetical protein